MPSLTNDQKLDFCLGLLHAETEEGVIEVLNRNGYWHDRDVWKPYGDIPNNRSIVGAQMSSPVAALVEKLVNSLDAVLTYECFKHGIDPTSKEDSPSTMLEATEKFFGIKDGMISRLGSAERTQLAERIQLVACGTKSQPAYMIIDDGEGQCPDKFPDTFLSLIRENKTKIRFVQGKFNMGGTGVLQFAGTNSFQLIVSRRQPDIPASSSDISNAWGFTITRRLSPGEDQPQSTYVYLAPNDEIFSFFADSLPLRPGRYSDAYEGLMNAGTCIKIWNYKVPARLKSLITLDLRYALERYLQDPVLPFRIFERRPGYSAHSYETTVSGLLPVLYDRSKDLELQTGTSLHISEVGDVGVRIFVTRESGKETQTDRFKGGLFYLVNGQLHAQRKRDFIAGRTGYDYLAKSLLVVIDCTKLPQVVREDIFMTSRDRMRQIPEQQSLEAAIIEYLKDHPALRELNARRREERMSKGTEDETIQILQELVKADPTLAFLFGKGKKIKLPGGPLPEPVDYKGEQFPTYFRIKNEPKDGLVKRCPQNRTVRVDFETDAENDYFDRVTDPGLLKTRGTPELMHRSLWNGNAQLRFNIPESANIGDIYKVEVNVSDIAKVEPLSSHFRIEVEEETDAPPSPPTRPFSGSQLGGLPNVEEVRRDMWGYHDFNELSAISIHTGDEDALDIYVNMDNLHLRNEIARRRKMDPATINHLFKWGMVLLALGMLHQGLREEEAQSENEDETDVNGMSIYEKISSASKGIALTLIPALLQLGSDENIPR